MFHVLSLYYDLLRNTYIKTEIFSLSIEIKKPRTRSKFLIKFYRIQRDAPRHRIIRYSVCSAAQLFQTTIYYISSCSMENFTMYTPQNTNTLNSKYI